MVAWGSLYFDSHHHSSPVPTGATQTLRPTVPAQRQNNHHTRELTWALSLFNSTHSQTRAAVSGYGRRQSLTKNTVYLHSACSCSSCRRYSCTHLPYPPPRPCPRARGPHSRRLCWRRCHWGLVLKFQKTL